MNASPVSSSPNQKSQSPSLSPVLDSSAVSLTNSLSSKEELAQMLTFFLDTNGKNSEKNFVIRLEREAFPEP